MKISYMRCTLFVFMLPVLVLEAAEISTAFHKSAQWNLYGELSAKGKSLAVLSEGETSISNVNKDGKRKWAPFLVSKDKVKDLHLKMEFMIPKESNSGVYVMGRYEIQILDSLGKAQAGFGDLGGLYQRWDDQRNPKGFEGVAPKVNAAKAPGEWQSMEIIFRAPRFAENGTKLHHAKFIKVLVNDQLVHENQVAKGPTRSSRFKDETARPEAVFIQGDHGPIAIRKFELKELTLSTEGEQPLEGVEAVPLDSQGRSKVNAVELGKQVFLSQGCVECHAVKEGEIKTGPSLYGLFTPAPKEIEVFESAEGHKKKRPADNSYLIESLRRPAEVLAIKEDGSNHFPVMPPYGFKLLNDEDVNAVYHYLLTLNPAEEAGPAVVWVNRPSAKYVLAKDKVAVLVKDVPRLERVEMGENLSGRAYHVGLPGDMNYSFDPRSMAVAQIWDGPFMRKHDVVGRGSKATEKGFKHRNYTQVVNLFQPYDAAGQLVDLSYSSPAKMHDAGQSQKFLADRSDFLAQLKNDPAQFIGVDTPKQKIPRFNYRVNDNQISLELRLSSALELEANFDLTLKSEQHFFIPGQGLENIQVSAGEIREGKWIVPAGEHKSLSFKAKLSVQLGELYDSAITAAESHTPQKMHWTASSKKARSHKAYRVEDASLPKDPFGRDLVFDPLGIEFLNEEVFVSTRTAGIWKIVNNQWHLFAEGCYESIGMVVNAANDIVIGEKAGLTRLIDHDGDHWAEKRINLTDKFRFNGDYHEYLHGPIKRDGKYLFTLNLGNKVHGMYKANGAWMGTVGGLRGWMLSSDEAGNTETFASGFRSPAGLSLSPQNEIVYTENQGEYVGTSKLFKVLSGKFYGNPTGLLDTPGLNVNSPEIKWETAKEKRELPVVLFPHNKTMNAPGSPEFLTDKINFGPFSGQMFVGDQTKSNIYRVDTEIIDGQEQGVIIPFMEDLKSGAMRLRFDPRDSSLWVGQTGRGWRATGGSLFALQRIIFDPAVPVHAIKTVKVTKQGFDIHFTQPQEKTDNYGNIACASWYYLNSHEYGSPEQDMRQEVISAAVWNAAKTVCSISLENFTVAPKAQSSDSSRVYFIDLSKTALAESSEPNFAKAYYTLHKIPQ